jgi:hypothetical protein
MRMLSEMAAEHPSSSRIRPTRAHFRYGRPPQVIAGAQDASLVPRLEPPWLVEPEEQPLVMMPLAEVATLEMRHVTQPDNLSTKSPLPNLSTRPPWPK